MSSWEYTLAHIHCILVGIFSIPVFGKSDKFLIWGEGRKYKILRIRVIICNFISFNFGEKKNSDASETLVIFAFLKYC